MKRKILFLLVCVLLVGANNLFAQNYGMRDDGGVNLPTITYWHTGLATDITEKGFDFNGNILGNITDIYIKDASIKTEKSGTGDVTGTKISYKVWKQGDTEPVSYTEQGVGWTSDDGSGNQTWSNFGTEMHVTNGLSAGNYNLKILFSVQGTGTPGMLENGAFIATFSINPMVLEYTVSAGTEIILPLKGAVNCAVNWGDSPFSQNITTATNVPHTYTNAGTYTVTIGGALTGFGSDVIPSPDKLTKCTSFGDIGLSDLSYAFKNASNLTVVPTTLPATVLNLAFLLKNATAFNQNLTTWNVSNVTNMAYLFNGATSFNQPLNGWNVGSVHFMDNMFNGATEFDQPLNSWNVTNVSNMSGMFAYATSFNQPLNSWVLGSITNTAYMFRGATSFNQALSSWAVGTVFYMDNMFRDATAFNQDLSGWDVSKVTNMSDMFNGATAFNSVLNGWNVGAVVYMPNMFKGATAFNKPLNGWDVSSVNNMAIMFQGATLFNQPLNSWVVGNVSFMDNMFNGATSFDQDLSTWNVSNVTAMNDMFSGVTLSTANYDALLKAWSALTLKPNVNFHGGNSKYSCGDAEAARAILTSALKNWTVTDGGMTCSTTWTGTAWDNGTPDASTDAIINDDYYEATGFTCKDLTVNNGSTLNIAANQTVTVEGDLVNYGNILLRSDGSTATTGALITKNALTNNNTMNAEKFLTVPKGVGNGNWHFLASPIAENIAVESILLSDYVYRYLQTPAWESLVSGNLIVPKVGYLVQTVQSSGKYITFDGTFNTGDFTVPLATAGDKWNLVGNPYPSPLDLYEISLTDASDYFYLWNLTTSNYQPYAQSTNTGFRYVPALTGFFAGAIGAIGETKSAAPANSELQIPNTARVSNDVFLKIKTTTQNELIHFTVNNSGEMQDNVYILLSETEVNAPKMFSLDNTAPQSYIFEKDEASSIKSYLWSKEERIIPIAFESETSGTYSLNMEEFSITDKAYLRDLQTGAWFSLSESTSYEFTHNKANNKLRFELVLNPKTTGVENVDVQIAQIYANKDVIYVNLAQAQNTTISVFDLSGRKVKEVNTSATSVQINDLQNGTYLVRVNSDKGNAVQKVFIND